MIKKLIDIKLIQKVMQESENDYSIEVNDIVFIFATNKGDNYASEMFRASIEYTRSNGIKKEKKSLIIKAEPLSEGLQKDLITKSELFTTEMNMIMNTLVKMNELVKPEACFSGRGLYTQIKPSLLIMEDLAPLGFRMADRLNGLDDDHSLLAIRSLARFHASSVALCEKDPSVKQCYTHGMFSANQPKEMQMFFIEGVKNLSKEMVNWPELDPKIPQKLEKIADTVFEKASKANIFRDNEFNVINHGDYWINNMMFKYNDKNQPIAHIFVDFQFSHYSSPGIDLQYFFNTSLNDNYFTKNEQKLLEEYLRTLTLTMSRLKCQTKAPTMDELMKMYKDRAFLGMMASLIILPIILVKKDESMNINELMDASVNGSVVYGGKSFRKAIVKRLPIFDKMGFLD
ncbi:PREDICTED: uncharacterized protein LOC105365253 [Ceratosolen solmsi marchali]|uniref:Uncharacterized protein LOC105365253 n=1 Tax=Ceratosolen solmsi marchali TaxID=326594 RepID=A0AAJ6YP69_9HYME|nr:PREDICTED: uncharacterized protein LOC105365253 [Ceratosolen solmsi marchali]